MGMFDELKEQAEKAVKEHPDQVEKVSDLAIDRGGDLADDLTHDKYADKVDRAQRVADDKIGE
jgi:hypothetical protein